MRKLKVVSGSDAQAFLHIARFALQHLKDAKLRNQVLGSIKDKGLRKASEILLDLFRGKKIRKGPGYKTALGSIAAIFRSHAESHYVPPDRGIGGKGTPEDAFKIFSCKCSSYHAKYREVLERLGELGRIRREMKKEMDDAKKFCNRASAQSHNTFAAEVTDSNRTNQTIDRAIQTISGELYLDGRCGDAVCTPERRGEIEEEISRLESLKK